MGKNLVRNLETNVSQPKIDLEGNELSHAFVFPLRRKEINVGGSIHQKNFEI